MMNPTSFCLLLVFLSKIIESTRNYHFPWGHPISPCLVQGEVSLEIESKNKAIRSNFNMNKRKLKLGQFWNRAYKQAVACHIERFEI